MAAFWLDPVRATQEISLSPSGKQTAAEEEEEETKGLSRTLPAHPAPINGCARGEMLCGTSLWVPLEVKGLLNSPHRCRGWAKSHTLLHPRFVHPCGLYVPLSCQGWLCACGMCFQSRCCQRREDNKPTYFLQRVCSLPAGMDYLTPISKELNVAAFERHLFSMSVRDPRSTCIRD